MATDYRHGKQLDMIHDAQQVRDLRLAAAMLQEQTAAVHLVGLLEMAAERIEWLSQCVSAMDRQRRAEGQQGEAGK